MNYILNEKNGNFFSNKWTSYVPEMYGIYVGHWIILISCSQFISMYFYSVAISIEDPPEENN